MSRQATAQANQQRSSRNASSTPPALATVTDLRAEETKAITEALNPLVADAFAFYTKIKNFHWHLSGPRFRDLHLMLDEHADQVLASIDVLAERARRVGGTTIRSIGHIAKLQTIEDDDEAFVSAIEMLRRLMEDNLHIAAAQRKAIKTCEDNRDSVTGNLLQEMLDETEKRKWFLFELIQDEGDVEA